VGGVGREAVGTVDVTDKAGKRAAAGNDQNVGAPTP